MAMGSGDAKEKGEDEVCGKESEEGDRCCVLSRSINRSGEELATMEG